MRQILLLVIMMCPSCDNVTWVGGEDDYEYFEAGREIRPPDLGEEDTDSNLDFSLDLAVPIIDAAPPPVDVMPIPDAPLVCRPYGKKESCEMQNLLGPCSEGERFCRITEWTQCYQVNNPRQETCDAIDNDCDGRNNEAPTNLGPNHANPQNVLLSRMCYTGDLGTDKNGPCTSGVSTCESSEGLGPEGPIVTYSYGECQNQILPQPEECDTTDNDCDGTVDEGVLNACAACGHVPDEVCDDLDNDCDGTIDEGLRNACDECGPLPRELCDFVDNDCDGSIDEDFLEGDCNCDHPDYVPQPEVCNGLDDDCDGFIDEGPLGGPLTKLCSGGRIGDQIILYDRREDGPQYVAGDCRLGISFCELGRNQAGEMQKGFYECLQEIPPQIERCNELDDDCDGNIDENFDQGQVAVLMVVDISGSMDINELQAAFTATRDSIGRLANDGVLDVCYMLAVVGNDERHDPYLFHPADTCVPGLEDPRIVPFEDMSAAVSGLRNSLRNGSVNQGGSTENTLDAIGNFFTDDLIDWNQDGILENVLWSTDSPSAQLRGITDRWDVDLSQYEHRVVIVLGDEQAQGAEWSVHDATRAMVHSGGTVFVIGTNANQRSYQPLIDFGATHTSGLDGFGIQSAQNITDAINAAIDEAACRRAAAPAPAQNNDGGIPDASAPDAGMPDGMACYENSAYDKTITSLLDTYKLVSYSYEHHSMCL